MTIFSLVASHQNVDLATVAHLASGVSALPEKSKELGLEGMVVLSTCNRLEIYGEVPTAPGTRAQAGAIDVTQAKSRIYEELTHLSGLDSELVESSFETHINQAAAHHLFTVSAGLESAVVGEREITGQVRRAISAAQEKGEATGNLIRLFDHAAYTARQVGQRTLLGSRGRSVVSVALDLADDVAEKTWQERVALVFGTGAYAGATVAALRERGCQDISVYSQSGRAATFADKRAVTPIAPSALRDALTQADIVIGCSGSSSPLEADAIPAGKKVILDLALSRDFAPEVADLVDVELITLESVRLAAPEETSESVSLARTIVDTAAAEFAVKEKARNIDAAIVALREHTMGVLDTELAKVRNQYGCGAAAEQLELAMRRMVRSLLHTPTVRARTLAKEGREEEYIAALEALYGIEVESPSREALPQADAS